MVGGEAWSLIGKRSSLAAIIARAPSSTFAETGSTALPGLRALLGTLPVVGLSDGAVLVVGMGGSVLGPVAVPEFSSIIILFAGSRDEGVSETN